MLCLKFILRREATAIPYGLHFHHGDTQYKENGIRRLVRDAFNGFRRTLIFRVSWAAPPKHHSTVLVHFRRLASQGLTLHAYQYGRSYLEE